MRPWPAAARMAVGAPSTTPKEQAYLPNMLRQIWQRFRNTEVRQDSLGSPVDHFARTRIAADLDINEWFGGAPSMLEFRTSTDLDNELVNLNVTSADGDIICTSTILSLGPRPRALHRSCR